MRRNARSLRDGLKDFGRENTMNPQIYLDDEQVISPAELRADDRNVIMAWQGRTSPRLVRPRLWLPMDNICSEIYGFRSNGDTITWTVVAPAAGSYRLAVLYGGAREVLPGCEIQVSVGSTSVRLPCRPVKTPDGPGNLCFRRDWLPAALPLQQGANTIELALSGISERQVTEGEAEAAAHGSTGDRGRGWRKGDSFSVYSIELMAEEHIPAWRREIEQMRSDTQWLVDGKYGLFVHWAPKCYPLHGETRAYDNWQWGVDRFDVGAFCDMVESTGAAWVLLTMNHQEDYFPFPSEVADSILPGRTASRDLVGELADALATRGVRLMLYYQYGVYDTAWQRAVGMLDRCFERWFDNELAFLSDIALRYGDRLAGLGSYIDRGGTTYYQSGFPWRRLAKTLKSGNPDGIMGVSNNHLPCVCPYSDLVAQDSGARLNFGSPPEWFEEGGPFEGLQSMWFFFMDGWVPAEPYNGVIRRASRARGGPIHAPEDYVSYFRDIAAAGIPATINMLITQDVTRHQPFVHPDCLAVMQQVKKATKTQRAG